MENKLPDVMAEFKKGNLPEEGLKKMVELAKGIIPQYKSWLIAYNFKGGPRVAFFCFRVLD